PVDELRLPMLERALQRAVGRQVDVVRNLFRVVDAAHDQTLSQLNCALEPVPYTFRAPFSPTALGRMKIQFCHADRRPNTRVNMFSRPVKRSEASMPVSASGDSATRSSMAMRTSSSQPMSSGAEVMRPRALAAFVSRGLFAGSSG